MSSLFASSAAPQYVAVSDDLAFLDLTNSAGEGTRLAASRLRAACKCAHCVRARFDSRFPDRFDGIAITEVSPVGDYAINIAFSDGHARGIYPWSYLSELKAG